jgi:hypothetical protein
MSSMKTTTNLLSSCMKTEFIRYCWCIGNTKRHDQIFIESISGGKGCFWNVTRSDLDLMISGAEVNLREYFGSG